MQDYIKLNQSAFRLLLDSQVVITQRTLGLCGLRPMDALEPVLMGVEKAEAFYEAACDAQLALIEGKSASQIANAALGPLARKARANRNRLRQ